MKTTKRSLVLTTTILSMLFSFAAYADSAWNNGFNIGAEFAANVPVINGTGLSTATGGGVSVAYRIRSLSSPQPI